jgi:hypothetical protein
MKKSSLVENHHARRALSRLLRARSRAYAPLTRAHHDTNRLMGNSSPDEIHH